MILFHVGKITRKIHGLFVFRVQVDFVLEKNDCITQNW